MLIVATITIYVINAVKLKSLPKWIFNMTLGVVYDKNNKCGKCDTALFLP